MSEKKFNCDCLYNEVGEGTGNVKGYELVSECDVCKARREADNAAREAEKQVQEEKELAIAVLRVQARAKLLALGLTEEEIDALLK